MSTLVLQPDAAAGKDTHALPQQPTTNYGTNVQIISGAPGAYHAFLEFDLSSIPAGSICNSATLTLTSAINNSTKTYSIYSLHSNVATWTEGGLTWNNYKAGTAWPGSAGGSTAGTDYESGSIGSIVFPNYNINQAANASLNASRVQGWFGSSNTNYGITIRGDNASRQWHSSDASTASYRPKLTIDYTLVLDVDAVIQRLVSDSFLADAYFLAQGGGSFPADARILKVVSGSYTADAVINVLKTQSGILLVT